MTYKKITLIFCVLLAITGVVFYKTRQVSAPEPTVVQKPIDNVAKNDEVSEITASRMPQLQEAVDNWTRLQAAEYAVQVNDVSSGQVLATHLGTNTYFMASIYKLYVVYVALLQVEKGSITLDEKLSTDYSVKECIDRAIRLSDSPCGEALLLRLGWNFTDESLKLLELTNTSFGSFTTSVADTSTLLLRLANNKDLDDEHSKLILDAMAGQKYRSGLPTGMPDFTVYDKVGFNETFNYHDVAIVKDPDNRSYVISVLSLNNGSPVPLAELGAILQTEILNQTGF
jgi:beta-lactamase class A